MARPTSTRRPDFKYLVASGLLGFVLGAFVVASLGNMGSVRGTNAAASAATAVTARLPLAPLVEPFKTPASTAIDDSHERGRRGARADQRQDRRHSLNRA